MKITEQIRLSQHFLLEEFLRSETADQCGIDNTIDTLEHMNNGYRLAKELERIRKLFGDKPIIVSSGFRCDALNRKVGGVKSSDHTKFLAADINVKGIDTEDVYNTIKEYVDGLNADQVIFEFNTDGSRTWVHFAIPELNDEPKRECFAMGVR